MENEPEFVDGTLAWCNEKRMEQGQDPLRKLPKGTRRDGSSCPCGKATGYYVGATTYYKIIDGNVRNTPVGPVPADVSDFVRDFDKGKLPQYVDKRRPEKHF